MSPPTKRERIIKILQEAKEPLSAQQIAWMIPGRRCLTTQGVAQLLRELDVAYVRHNIGHGYKRVYFIPSNPNIKVQD